MRTRVKSWAREKGVRRLVTGIVAGLILGLCIWIALRQFWPDRVEPLRPESRESVPVSVALPKNDLPSGFLEDDAEALPEELLVGRVIAKESGRPIAGAMVSVTERGDDLVSMQDVVVSSKDGHFSVDFPTSEATRGQSKLHILAEGYRPWLGTPGNIQPGKDGIRLVALEEGDCIEGQVRGIDGQAIEGASVWAASPGNRAAWPAVDGAVLTDRAGGARAQTDAGGRFVLRGLDPSVGYEVRASAPLSGGPPLWPIVPGGTTGVSIELKQACHVELAYRNSAGDRIEPLAVTLEYSGESVRGFRGVNPVWCWKSNDCESPAQGVRHLYYLPKPDYHEDDHPAMTFHLKVPGYLPQSVGVPLEVGSRVRKEVVFEPDPAFSYLRPVVLRASLPSGAAFDGGILLRMIVGDRSFGWLDLSFCEGVSLESIPMPVGRVRLDPISGGGSRSTVAYLPKSHPPMWIDVPAGDGPVQLPVVLMGDFVELEVLSSEGSVVRGYDLRVVGDGIRWGGGRSGPSGGIPWQYEWDGNWRRGRPPDGTDHQVLVLPAGRHTVSVNLPGVGGASGTVDGDGSGRKFRLSLVLDPRQEAPLREQLQALLAHQRQLSTEGR